MYILYIKIIRKEINKPKVCLFFHRNKNAPKAFLFLKEIIKYNLYYYIIMICTPALLYLLLCTIQIILDFMNGLYNTAFVKMIVTIIITFFLNILCEMDLGFISWIIVLIPFLFMTLIVGIILYALGYDIATGKTIQPIEQQQQEEYYLQTGYTSPPIPPKFLPEVVTTIPPNKNPPIEEKNIYLISYNPNQHHLPIPYPDIHVYHPPTPPPGPTPGPIPGPIPGPPSGPIPGPPPTPPPNHLVPNHHLLKHVL